MKNSHIAFVSFPHPPHVNPTLPIVSVLVRRGFRVTYATSHKFASRVAELGAEVVSCPEFRVGSLSETEEFDRVICELEEITPFYERNRPDLLVYDFMSLAGRILANRWDVPAIQTSPTFALDKDNLSHQVKDPELRKVILDWSKQINLFLEHHGIASGNFLFHRERLNIHLFPKALQLEGGALGEGCFYAGRCAGEQPYYGDWQKKNSEGKPIALVGTSTTHIRGPEYFRMCIAALSGLQWHVVLSVGDACDAASLMPLPPHFEIVRNTSHIKILRHASLYICLGGIITTAEAMYHGLPLIVTTHGALELEWQADNIESLGIGIHLRKADTNSENLRRAAIHVSEDHVLLQRVKQMQRAVQREPGGEETVNRIEEFLETC